MSFYHRTQRSPSARSDQSAFFQNRSFSEQKLPQSQGLGSLAPGRLMINVIEAKGLHNPRLFGQLDPYCRLTLGKHVLKTEVTRNSDNPKWDYSEGIDIQGTEPSLLVEVFHKGIVGHRNLGHVEIPLSELLSSPASTWYNLTRNEDLVGMILLKSKFQPTTVGSPLAGAQDYSSSANFVASPVMATFSSPQSLPGGISSRYDNAYIAPLPAAVAVAEIPPPVRMLTQSTAPYSVSSSSSSSSQPTVLPSAIDDVRSSSFRRVDTTSSLASDASGYDHKPAVLASEGVSPVVVDTQLPTSDNNMAASSSAHPISSSSSFSASSNAFQPFSANMATPAAPASSTASHPVDQPIRLSTVIPFGEASHAPIVIPLTLATAVPTELLTPLPTFRKPPAGVQSFAMTPHSGPMSSDFSSSAAQSSSSNLLGTGGMRPSKEEGSLSINKHEKSVSSVSSNAEDGNQVGNMV